MIVVIIFKKNKLGLITVRNLVTAIERVVKTEQKTSKRSSLKNFGGPFELVIWNLWRFEKEIIRTL